VVHGAVAAEVYSARRRVERELDEELQFHLEPKSRKASPMGFPQRDARYAAMRAMDGLEQRKEEMRDMPTHSLVDGFLQRRALRGPEPEPHVRTYAFVVITLALVWVTSATFSMVDALIFRPYPVRIRATSSLWRALHTIVTSTISPIANTWTFVAKRRATTASSPTQVWRLSASVPNPSHARVRGGMMVSGNYFRVLGVEPRLGRGFREDEDQVPGRNAVVVLGPDFWKHEFAERPGRPRQDDSPERHGFHGDWRGSRNLPGDACIRASRLLHAAGDGAGVSTNLQKNFSRTATIASDCKGALETGHNAPAGAE